MALQQRQDVFLRNEEPDLAFMQGALQVRHGAKRSKSFFGFLLQKKNIL